MIAVTLSIVFLHHLSSCSTPTPCPWTSPERAADQRSHTSLETCPLNHRPSVFSLAMAPSPAQLSVDPPQALELSRSLEPALSMEPVRSLESSSWAESLQSSLMLSASPSQPSLNSMMPQVCSRSAVEPPGLRMKASRQCPPPSRPASRGRRRSPPPSAQEACLRVFSSLESRTSAHPPLSYRTRSLQPTNAMATASSRSAATCRSPTCALHLS